MKTKKKASKKILEGFSLPFKDYFKESKENQRVKVVTINGVKSVIILPPGVKKEDFPDKIKSEQNHPKGLVVSL